jgi:hypothetical protein
MRYTQFENTPISDATLGKMECPWYIQFRINLILNENEDATLLVFDTRFGFCKL